MNRCLIVAGAPIHDYDAVRFYIRDDDFAVYCDCGLRHLEPLGKPADLIIGDFDSHPRPVCGTEIITLPRAKDDTDSVYAMREAIKRGYDEFLLVGMVGARFDHSFCNIGALLWLNELGKKALLVDDFSEMEIIGQEPVEIPDFFPYFSLLAVDGTASGVTIENALFPLTDGTITPSYQYAVSNEVLPGKTARISIKNGRMLLLRDRH